MMQLGHGFDDRLVVTDDLVDDEADIRELLGMTLIRMGLEPHCAGSVAELQHHGPDRHPVGQYLRRRRHHPQLSRCRWRVLHVPSHPESAAKRVWDTSRLPAKKDQPW